MPLSWRDWNQPDGTASASNWRRLCASRRKSDSRHRGARKGSMLSWCVMCTFSAERHVSSVGPERSGRPIRLQTLVRPSHVPYGKYRSISSEPWKTLRISTSLSFLGSGSWPACSTHAFLIHSVTRLHRGRPASSTRSTSPPSSQGAVRSPPSSAAGTAQSTMFWK